MSSSPLAPGPIAIFDSGYGGLTIFREIEALLPDYDFIYLGDNARSPYGTRDFETLNGYTWEAVQALFAKGCSLIILACNTASARALRNIQQLKLPEGPPERRVLGVIRPTTEVIGKLSKNGHIGIMGTEGTIKSETYPIEIAKFFPEVSVYQQACPMLVPLVEEGEHDSAGADYFIKKYIDDLLAKAPLIDALLLACTHYPLLLEKIDNHLPKDIKIIGQGELVALSLKDYLQRHPELDKLCLKNGQRQFFTTGHPKKFKEKGLLFLGHPIEVQRIRLS